MDLRYAKRYSESKMLVLMHRPGIEPGAGRRQSLMNQMATANFTTKPPMLAGAVASFDDYQM
jgi:hypothetical protein